ncbi:hypothetical protein KUTeg_010159 [Tegillarca granosa]|uniref:X-box-binding protein 1 n=1 Tax=Tegillarca granosa TaxID=220873 RepID=A0ABQ9F4S5_TEGGR|nr:hypothetical protein KUTeg_009751 [Tegillarca granosa]KAJ8312786.1 hypothetical protein KUTeg_010159 [Tegillarca granosa]
MAYDPPAKFINVFKKKLSLKMSKTIVITTVPSRSAIPRTVTVNTQNINMEYLEDGSGPRKRRRLTNLTPEEKMLRRKLKNRVAAQTARDRKKALMSDLEIKVAELMEENKKLQQENVNLKEKSEILSVENFELKERLGLVDGSLVKTETESLGSAAPLVPLPQGQTRALFCSMMPYTATLFNVSNQNGTNTRSLIRKLVKVAEPHSKYQKGTTGGEQNAPMVGPSTEELESINELIKFDHIYYKLEPASQDLVVTESNVSEMNQNLPVGRLNIHITQDVNSNNDTGVISVNEENISPVNISEKDISNVLPDINMDLLEDIESILELDLGGQLDSQDEVSQNKQFDCANSSLVNIKEKEITANELCPTQCRKRKHSDTVPSPSPSDFDHFDSDTSYASSDSGVVSDFCDKDIASPYSDITGSLQDDPWEESFMELFPALS